MKLAFVWVKVSIVSFILFFNGRVCAEIDSRELTLETLLRTVNTSYPQIIAARLQVAKSRGDFISALGQFDPNVRVKTRQLPVGGYVSKYANNELDIPTLFNGLRFFGGYRIGVGDFPIYYQNFLTNNKGEYRAGMSLPLLKDRQIDMPRTQLLTRTETIALNKQEVISTKLSVYHDAIRAYWNWVQAGLQLKVLIDMLELAEVRQGALEKQANMGDLAMIAVVENKQHIMQRRQWVNRGEMALEQASISLSLYYRTLAGEQIIPSKHSLPNKVRTYKPNVLKNTDIEEQLKRHPDLCKLERYYHIVQLKYNLAKNELLPSLDTTAFASKQFGVDGYPLLLPQAVQIGVRFKFPIYQRIARGKVISTTSELRQVVTRKKFVLDQLNNQLSNMWVTLRTFQKQVGLVEEELQLALRVANAERKRFFAGGSSIFLINQREQTAAEVHLNLISAEVNLQKTQTLIKYFASTKID